MDNLAEVMAGSDRTVGNMQQFVNEGDIIHGK